MEIYADELRKQLADKISIIQRKDGISLYGLSSDIFGDERKLLKVMDSFDDIKHLQNELSKRTLEELE